MEPQANPLGAPEYLGLESIQHMGFSSLLKATENLLRY